MFYTVIKLDGHLKTKKTLVKLRKLAECFQMSGGFYHSIKHGLVSFTCLRYIDLNYEMQVENNNTCMSDKTGILSQSERVLDCIYVINS
jgi:hypothetical protein